MLKITFYRINIAILQIGRLPIAQETNYFTAQSLVICGSKININELKKGDWGALFFYSSSFLLAKYPILFFGLSFKLVISVSA